MESGSRVAAPRQLGRYALYGPIGSGGMATVHFGRLLGPSGFTRSVAIKRLHEQFACDQDFVDMLIDEAHMASRIAHVNVVPTLDVIAESGELWLVMDYVNGESLARLLDVVSPDPLPVGIAAALLTGVLHGLHAAHETRNERGELLGIVHRDVSPDNVLVGVDGVPRLADFGVAKARGRLRTTPAGQVKGKLAYMPCEQLRGRDVDRRADVYSAGALFWELLTGRLLFDGESEGEVITRVLHEPVVPPSRHNGLVPAVLDQAALRALSREPNERFATAREMANAIENGMRVATQSEIVDWLQRVAGPTLAKRAASMRRMVEQEPVERESVPASTRFLTPGQPERSHSSTRRLSEPTREPGGSSPSVQPPASPSLAPQSGSTPAQTGAQHERARMFPLWLALLAIGAGAFWWLSHREPPAQAPQQSVSAPAPQPQEVVPVQAPTSAPPHIEPAPAPVEATSVSEPPARERKRKKQATEKPKPIENDCSPPYYLDADGIRHVKRDCL